MQRFADLLSPLLRRPLLILALLWMGGIFLASSCPLPWGSWLLAALLFLVAWAIPGMHGNTARLALWGAVLCIAAGVSAWQTALSLPDGKHDLPTGGMLVRGYPLAPPAQTTSGWHVIFHVISRHEGAVWRPCACDIYLLGRTAPLPVLGHLHQILGKSLPAEETGNPFGLSWPMYLRANNLACVVTAYAITPLPATAPWSQLLTLRTYLERRMTATMTGEYGALSAQLLCGMVFGVHGEALPPQITERFRRAGTIHLLVASGSQVALLGGVLLFPLCCVKYGRNRTSYPRLRILLLLLSVPLLFGFVVLADRGPSIDRALLMAFLAMLSLFLAFSPLARHRSFRPDSLTLLAAATLVLLICRPAMCYNPAMQLSLVAVFGLITITPVLMRLLRHTLGGFAVFPAMSLAAQLMTAPVLAWHYGTISLIGPITNLLVFPLVVLLIPLAFITMLCAVILPPLASILNSVNIPLVRLLVLCNVSAANIPWAQCAWPLRSLWAALLYYLVLGAALLALSSWARRLERDWGVPVGREPRMW